MKENESHELTIIRKDLIPNSKNIQEKPFLIRIKQANDKYFNIETSLKEAEYIASEITQNIKDYLEKIRTFKINKYLSLKLIGDRTVIYVANRKFDQCKYLLLNIPAESVHDYDDIKSIDDASEKLDHNFHLGGHNQPSFNITPEMEFQGHCSNLQAWYENDYDTRLLHKNLAFPLLKRLAEEGDKLAYKRFKEEIALRIESEEPNVLIYLIGRKYLDYFSEEELELICENLNDPISIWLLKGHKERNKEFLRKYMTEVKGFLFKNDGVLLCNAKTCNKRLIHKYSIETSIFSKIKCRFAYNKKFLDFGIRRGNKQAVYSLENIRFGKELLKKNNDILIAIPKGPNPIRLHSPSQNLYVFIKQTEMIS